LVGRAKSSFVTLCKSSDDVVCVGPCPYNVVKAYYDLCPDKDGTEAAASLPNIKEPIFMRAKQLQGISSSHRFLLSPMGEHTTRLIPGRINSRLPIDLQVEGITPNSGRKGFVTNALDSGCAQALVAQASKHKDPRMLERYHSSSKSSLLSPALAIGDGMSTNLERSGSKKRHRIISSDDEEEQGDAENHHKSSFCNHESTSTATVVKNYYFNL